MWAIRILSGPLAGQIFPLKNGNNKVGRAPGTDICINSQGVSKEHLEIQVFSDKIILTDLKSSNGTFVNGVRTQNALLRMGDKVGVHNILLEVVAAPSRAMAPVGNSVPVQPRVPRQSEPQAIITSDFSQNLDAHTPTPQPAAKKSGPNADAMIQKVAGYNERVVLPALFQLSEVFEFRNVVMGFAVVFIVLVTLLSVIPMKQISSESIQIESRRRAQTVARALANANEKVIRQGDLSHISVDFVLREDGIDDVYIVSKDGTILSPPERAGSRPREAGFLKQVMGQTREIAGEVGIDRVAAAYPILSFDPEMQQNTARAYAVVIFNSGSLQFDDGRALSLFIQMLMIASALGALLFYFMYKVIERPWAVLKQELDQALRENRDHVQVNILFPAVQDFIVNLNSLLVRALNPDSVSRQDDSGFSRDFEMKNLSEMMGYPCLIFSRAGYIIALNHPFESLTGMSALSTVGQVISTLPDQAFRKNIDDLSQQATANPQQIVGDNFEISGHPLRIHCQAIANARGEAEYFVVTLTPAAQAEGGAA